MQRIDDAELTRIAVFHLREAARRLRLLGRQAGSPQLAAGLAGARAALEAAATELGRDADAAPDAAPDLAVIPPS